MGIVHGCALVVENGLDSRDAGAVARMNRRAYYDSVPTLRCCRWLEAKGAPAALCAAVVRHKFCPKIKVEAGGGEIDIYIYICAAARSRLAHWGFGQRAR